MAKFDMPASAAGFEARGGWLIQRLMTDFDLTAEQAGGLVGNLGFESTGFKDLHELGQATNVGGYGWAQWTADRRETFFAYCDEKGLDWRSDEANYGYLFTELKGPYSRTIKALKRVSDLGGAVFSVGQTFERPGGTTPTHLPGYAQRLAYAQRAMAGFRKLGEKPEESEVPETLETPETPVPTPTVTPAPGPTPTPSPHHHREPIPAIQVIQAVLKMYGTYTGEIDGDWGDASDKALSDLVDDSNVEENAS